MQRSLTLSGLLLIGLSLIGCSDMQHEPADTEPSHQPTSVLATDDPETEYLGDYEGIPEDTAGPRTPTAEQQQAAMERATLAVEAYYASDDPDQWFDNLEPMLSRQARKAYATVDPSRIPADVDVTGDASVVRHEGGGAITIAVPTTSGDTQVDLIVEEPGHDWTVDRFRLPSGGG